MSGDDVGLEEEDVWLEGRMKDDTGDDGLWT